MQHILFVSSLWWIHSRFTCMHLTSWQWKTHPTDKSSISWYTWMIWYLLAEILASLPTFDGNCSWKFPLRTYIICIIFSRWRLHDINAIDNCIGHRTTMFDEFWRDSTHTLGQICDDATTCQSLAFLERFTDRISTICTDCWPFDVCNFCNPTKLSTCGRHNKYNPTMNTLEHSVEYL